jgi:hypothetical protein
VQSVEKNCCRWLFFSQYADALPFDNKDRRVIVIANPTEPQAPEWYVWIRQFMQGDETEKQFIASIQHFLATYDLTGFNAGAHAPMNDAKRKALSLMESPAVKVAKQFALEWPEGLATMSDFKDYVGEDDLPKHPRAIGDTISAAGMARSDKRRLRIDGVQETILITRPSAFHPDLLRMMSPDQIMMIIKRGRAAFYN